MTIERYGFDVLHQELEHFENAYGIPICLHDLIKYFPEFASEKFLRPEVFQLLFRDYLEERMMRWTLVNYMGFFCGNIRYLIGGFPAEFNEITTEICETMCAFMMHWIEEEIRLRRIVGEDL